MQSDVIIVGGGLSGGLLALRLALGRPELRVLLLERSSQLGGVQTWGFSTTEAVPSWLQPVISKSWTKFDVRFTQTDKSFDLPYHVIRSNDFHAYLVKQLGSNVVLNCEVTEVSDSHVVTKEGRTYRAPLVIDSTGIHKELTDEDNNRYNGSPCGWMKYVGFELTVKSQSGSSASWHLNPTAMDARVPQMDGFRWFTTIPISDKILYVQETFLSFSAKLNAPRISRSLMAYVQRIGWEIDLSQRVLREEHAVVPLPLFTLADDRIAVKSVSAAASSTEDFIDRSPIEISSAKGWFHPTTGQAVLDSVRVADFIASQSSLRSGPVRAKLREFRRQWVEQQSFYRLFNRMVFKAAEPSLRHVAFDRVFSLKEDVVGRFLEGTTTRADAAKILATKPPLRTGKLFKNWASENHTEIQAENNNSETAKASP